MKLARIGMVLFAALLLGCSVKAADSEIPSKPVSATTEHPTYMPEVEEDPNVKYREKAGAISVSPEEHTSLPLWRNKDYLPYADENAVPVIIPYLAESAEPVGCVVIFPGGAYSMLSTGSEGTEAAQYICDHFGLSAFVVKYRFAPSNYRATLTDALRAIRFVRYYAKELNILPEQVAVLGFSAGGHLAMMTAEHYDYGKTGDAIDAMSSRPDAAFLCYPVGSLSSSYTHIGSRRNFLGNEDSEENRIRFSAELGLRPDMPPVYIIHCEDDAVVPIENSYTTVDAMTEAGLDITFKWYPTGGHGFGIHGVKEFGIDWPNQMQQWLLSKAFVMAGGKDDADIESTSASSDVVTELYRFVSTDENELGTTLSVCIYSDYSVLAAVEMEPYGQINHKEGSLRTESDASLVLVIDRVTIPLVQREDGSFADFPFTYDASALKAGLLISSNMTQADVYTETVETLENE